MSARQEFHRLAFALREMCPDHAIFEETNFAENVMDTSLFGSDNSDALQQLYRETRANSFCLWACINKVEQLALMNGLKTDTPPPLVEALPPPQAHGPQSQTGPGSGAVQGS